MFDSFGVAGPSGTYSLSTSTGMPAVAQAGGRQSGAGNFDSHQKIFFVMLRVAKHLYYTPVSNLAPIVE